MKTGINEWFLRTLALSVHSASSSMLSTSVRTSLTRPSAVIIF